MSGSRRLPFRDSHNALKNINLDAMINFAEDGMTMLCVTHEMGVAVLKPE